MNGNIRANSSKVNQELKAPNKYECKMCGIKISKLDVIKINKNSKDDFLLRSGLHHCFDDEDEVTCIGGVEIEDTIERWIDLLYSYREFNVSEIRCKNCKGYIKNDFQSRQLLNDRNLVYPWTVTDSWKEVLVCYCVNSYRASIAMCRVTLEEMLCEIQTLISDDEVDYQYMSNSIYKMIDDLKYSSIFDYNFRIKAEKVRYLSNQFIHSSDFNRENHKCDFEIATALIKDMSYLLIKFLMLNFDSNH